MEQNEYSKQRQQYIIDYQEKMVKRIKSLQRKFYAVLLDHFISNMITKDGFLRPVTSNYSLTYRSDRIIREAFIENGGSEFTDWLARRFLKLFNLNEAYFNDVIGPETKQYSGKILRNISGRLGYDFNNKYINPGGFFFMLLALPESVETVKRFALRAIQVSMDLSDFILNVKGSVLGDNQRSGSVEKEMGAATQDALPQFDRDTSIQFANDLQLNYAIYQGGLIKTSRPFCIERNNKVFSRDEILKFGTPEDNYGGYSNKSTGDFQGKVYPYDPILDLGSINCRHQLDWISDELAINLRPDLEE